MILLMINFKICPQVNQEPLSLAKAKKEKIKMMKLPLDKYLQWGAGSGKSLTLNQVTSILLDIKHTGDWKYALRHVPKRKLTDFTTGSEISKFGGLRYDKNALRSRYNWKPKSHLKSKIENEFSKNNSKLRVDFKHIIKE